MVRLRVRAFVSILVAVLVFSSVPAALAPVAPAVAAASPVTLAQPDLVRSNGADLSWSAAAVPAGSRFERYEVHRSRTAGFQPAPATRVVSIGSRGSTFYADTTAAPVSEFFYRVVSVVRNAGGAEESAASNEVRVTTTPAGKAVHTIRAGEATQLTRRATTDPCDNSRNYGAAPSLRVGAEQRTVHRGLLRLDLRRVPTHATITSARLTMSYDGTANRSGSIEVRRVQRAWVEGRGGADGACDGSGASWMDAKAGVPWTAAGGDAGDPVVTIPDRDRTAAGADTVTLTAQVADWVHGRHPNHGLLLRTAVEDTVTPGSRTLSYASDDAADVARRPVLVVEYEDAAAGPRVPRVVISTPSPDSTVRGDKVRLAAATTDDGHIAQVEFFVDGQSSGVDTTAPYESAFDSTRLANGRHEITARARDDAGNTGTSPKVAFTVDNTSPPQGRVSAPAPDAVVSGQVGMTVDARDDVAVAQVEVMVDGRPVGRDSAAPYAVTWNSRDPRIGWSDGKHEVTARITDSSGQVVSTAPVTVMLRNDVDRRNSATIALTDGTPFPDTMAENADPAAPRQDPYAGTHDPNTGLLGGSLGQHLGSAPKDATTLPSPARRASESCPAGSFCATVRVGNTGAAWDGQPPAVWYRWYAESGAVLLEGPADAKLPAGMASGSSAEVPITVAGPKLPPGITSGRYHLRLDLLDPSTGTWFSTEGSSPLETVTTVLCTSCKARLGLEKFWTYEGEPTGAGSVTMTNVANGNMLWRWNPWTAPGRGLASVLDITHNSGEDTTFGLLGHNVSYSVSGLTRLSQPLDIFLDLPIIGRPVVVELTDGDGTRHRFERGSDGNWRRPPGVHLFLRQVTSDRHNPRYWALSRPDNITFYYDADGFPTAVVDRNGNTITFELEPSPPVLLGLGLGYPKKRVTRVVDPGGRAFTFEYTPTLDPLLPVLRGKVKRITDHDGSALDFEYYDNGNLLRIIQRGGSTATGAFLPDRSFVFTYTTLLGNEYAIPDPADRVNPDPHILLQSSRIATIRDPRGNETRYSYYTDNSLLPLKWRLKSRENRATGTTTFGYDTDRRITTVTAPLGRVTRYTLDQDGKATSIVNAKGETTGYTWSPDFHVSKVTEDGGAFTSFAYNDAGYLTSQIDQLGNTTRLDYELRRLDNTDTGTHFALLSKVTQPEGVATPAGGDFETTFGYDPAGNPIRQTDSERHNTIYDWNLAGSPAPGTLRRVTDPRGNPTLLEEYDPNGYPTKITDAEGGISRANYTPDGLLRWSQTPTHERYHGQPDERSYRTFVDYDAFHRPGRTSTPKGTEQARGLLVWNTHEFDANDNVIASRSPVFGFDDPGAGPLTEIAVDAMDRQAIVVGPDRHDGEEKIFIQYDAAGRKISESTPRGSATEELGDYTTSYTYDLLDRVVRVGKRGAPGEPERNSWTCYDNVGNKTADVAPNAGLATAPPCPVPASVSHVRRFEYDAAHRLAKTIDPLGRTTELAYNRNGWAHTETDAARKTTTTVFDQRGLTVEKTQSYLGNRRLINRFVFDGNGNMVKEISARAVEKNTTTDYVTEVSFDKLNRPVRLTLPKDGALEVAYRHQVYDADSRLVMSTLPITSPTLPADLPAAAKTEMSYFDIGQIATSDDGPNPEVLFDYTPEGWQSQRVPRLTDDDTSPPDTGKTMLWSFQPDGQLIARTDEDGQRATYSYDRNNNLAEANVASGVIDPGERAILIRNDYNGFDELTRSGETKLHDDASRRVEQFTTYDYDRDGNLTFRGDEGKAGAQTSPVKRNIFSYDTADQLATQFELGTDTGCAGDRRIDSSWSPQAWLTRRLIAVARPSCTVEQSPDPGSWETVQEDTRGYADNGNLIDLTTRNGAGEVKESHQISYDQDGAYIGERTRDVVRLAGPDAGKPCATTACTQTWSFDARNRVTRHQDGHGGTYEFRLDEPGSLSDNRVRAGNVTTEVTPSGTLSRSYVGNQLTETRQSGEAVKHWYDSLGRLDCVTKGTGTAADCSPSTQVSDRLITDYAYDYLDRLESVRFYDNRTLKRESLYQNDALDRVVTQVERHIEPARTQTKRSEFAYLGIANQVAAETRLYNPGNGNPEQRSTKSYSYDNIGTLIRMVDQTANRQPDGSFGPPTTSSATFVMDPHASVSLLLNDSGPDKGKARASYAYTPYGAEDEAVSTGDTDEVNDFNPYRYTGKRRDTGSGTLDMGSRRYDPSTTRFLQQDIFRGALANLGLSTDPLTQNRYALAGGNPTSFIEADGHRPMADGGGSYNPDEGSTPEQAEENQRARATPREFNGEQAVKEFLGDVTGWNDIRDCVTRGDVGACVSAIVGIGLGAIFKAGKVIKGIYRIIDKFFDWKRQRSWADGVLKAADERRAAAAAARQADEAAKAAAKQADEATAAAAKQGDDATAAAAKQADEGAPARSTKSSTCDIKNSFTPDTPVLLADGTRKPISEVEVGDRVTATDPETGRTEARPVTAVITGDGAKNLVELTVDTDGDRGDATGLVVATEAHPFWAPNRGRWVDASDLKPGDLLRTAAGSYVQITAVRSWTQPARVHNLTVADLHTYHVAAGTTDVLVHNCGGGRKVTLLGRKRPIEKYIKDHPDEDFDADFLNLRGTQKGPTGEFTKGPGSWTWQKNKRFIDEAIDRGDEIRLVTDPTKPMYEGGNTYARELKYLMGKGYGWEKVGDHWGLTRVRP